MEILRAQAGIAGTDDRATALANMDAHLATVLSSSADLQPVRRDFSSSSASSTPPSHCRRHAGSGPRGDRVGATPLPRGPHRDADRRHRHRRSPVGRARAHRSHRRDPRPDARRTARAHLRRAPRADGDAPALVGRPDEREHDHARGPRRRGDDDAHFAIAGYRRSPRRTTDTDRHAVRGKSALL